MYAIALLHGMVFYGPIATLYRQTNGLTIFQISLIEGISYLLCILLEIPWGILADKIGYKKSMSLCCCLYLISKIVFWRAFSFWSFLLERILLSIVIAGFSGVDTSILYLSCNKNNSQKAFAIYNGLGLVGLLLSSLIYSMLIKDNYPMAAFCTVISYMVAAVLSFFIVEVKNTEANSLNVKAIKGILSRLVNDKRFILFLISVAFLSQTHQTITVFLNQIQYENVGLSNSTIGYVFIIVTLAGLIGVFSSKLSRILGFRLTGILLHIIVIVSCIILIFAKSAIASVLAIALLNITYNLYEPYQLEIQNKSVHSTNRATELSIYAMIVNCICIGTSILYGVLANYNLNYAFCFGAVICFVGFLFFSICNNSKIHP